MRIIASFLIVLSLLLGPVAHAAGLACEKEDCGMQTQQDKESGKLAKAAHHCCCPHVSLKLDSAMPKEQTVSATAYFPPSVHSIVSTAPSAPLKPPSHV